MNLNELGVKMVTIDLPFRLNHVNCFVAESEDGTVTVIDTGLNNSTSKEMWLNTLRGKKVSNLFLTHYHPDHYGYAGQLQEYTEAKVWMSREDAKVAKIAWEPDTTRAYQSFYYQCGLPAEMINKLSEDTRGFIGKVTPHPTINHHFDEGMKVNIGKYEYEVIFTPGHSGGLVCFFNREKSILFSTDHILPKITPNISYHVYSLQNPLATYLQSLEKTRELEANFVIPSHGKPFYNANQRIDEIIHHHKERIEETYDIIGQGINVIEACKKLFQKEFTIHDVRFALGETVAHLEYLYHQKECTKELREGQWYYQVK
ncbi:MBL fold metallo-hydrolase [Alkalihalobacterium alkalinitrilicum]|uniref:MBL fold metallo-hydrolase n=1 Tax=Alkalihalobacterium alkalinitrilicum TaxID=427920 RepID=UPI000995183F|nr:MBL fold metallo-hydrolase [Alkalihalobacterium alkalinitrilicum]